jgi:ferredoxin
MPHIVTERCVDCRYTDCCAVCPVECFYEVKDPAMLVIDPDTCIDCGLCIPECPIYAIFPKAELPAYYQDWIQKNAELWKKGTKITAKVDPLPTAIPLNAIHEREKAKGWAAKDPSAVSDEGAGAAAAAAAAPAPAAAPPPAAAAPQAVEKQPEKKARVRIPKTPKRPPLGIAAGARLKIRHRLGTVIDLRERADDVNDVLLQLDGEPRPCWYLYSALQTYREKGELEILDPGRKPGLLARMFSV